MPIAQSERLISIETPLGKDALLLEALEGTEAVSQLFRFSLYLLAENNSLNFGSLVGKPATVTIASEAGQRNFHGIINHFSQGHGERLYRYHAVMVPSVWNLTQTSNVRIFQEMTVPDIIKKVFSDRGFTDYQFKLTGSYQPRTYCVQYRESDFNFISRLMEEEGIFYFFEHGEGSHKMIIGDSNSAFQACPGQASVTYAPKGGPQGKDFVSFWRQGQVIRTAKQTLNDYNFETPTNDLKVNVPTKATVGRNDKLEIYDYAGGYQKRPEGERLAKLRMEQEEAQHTQATGASSVRTFVAGYTFNLSEHYRGDYNGSYVLTSVTHQAASNLDGETSYSNTFTCIPASLPFRPARMTPKPVVHGLESAVVVGPSGEEIYTDKYGRVKVQFHWDREGKKDDHSSCWVRVAQPLAGKQWGGHFWPRIGQEVLLAFLQGDPDRPLIVGTVYNGDNMPPYALPDNQTRSGFKTRSSKSGSADNFNELRFEDKKGEEEIYFHAEKDFNRVVENNDTLKVGFEKKDDGNQTIEIHNNQSLKVGNAQSREGSQTVVIWKDQKETIKTGNRDVKIEMGNDSLQIKMGNRTEKLDLGKSETEAMQSIELKVGQSSIKIDQMGVTIKGMMIKIEGQMMTDVKGLMTNVKGDAMLIAKGGLTMIN